MIAAQNVVPLTNEDKSGDAAEDGLGKVVAAPTTDDLLMLNGENQGDRKTVS